MALTFEISRELLDLEKIAQLSPWYRLISVNGKAHLFSSAIGASEESFREDFPRKTWILDENSNVPPSPENSNIIYVNNPNLKNIQDDTWHVKNNMNHFIKAKDLQQAWSQSIEGFITTVASALFGAKTNLFLQVDDEVVLDKSKGIASANVLCLPDPVCEGAEKVFLEIKNLKFKLWDGSDCDLPPLSLLPHFDLKYEFIPEIGYSLETIQLQCDIKNKKSLRLYLLMLRQIANDEGKKAIDIFSKQNKINLFEELIISNNKNLSEWVNKSQTQRKRQARPSQKNILTRQQEIVLVATQYIQPRLEVLKAKKQKINRRIAGLIAAGSSLVAGGTVVGAGIGVGAGFVLGVASLGGFVGLAAIGAGAFLVAAAAAVAITITLVKKERKRKEEKERDELISLVAGAVNESEARKNKLKPSRKKTKKIAVESTSRSGETSELEREQTLKLKKKPSSPRFMRSVSVDTYHSLMTEPHAPLSKKGGEYVKNIKQLVEVPSPPKKKSSTKQRRGSINHSPHTIPLAQTASPLEEAERGKHSPSFHI